MERFLDERLSLSESFWTVGVVDVGGAVKTFPDVAGGLSRAAAAAEKTVMVGREQRRREKAKAKDT